jgi:hypothetical protein
MIPFRRAGAVLTGIALMVTTLSAWLVRCDMTRWRDGATQTSAAPAHRAAAHDAHRGDAPGAQRSDHQGESHAPASCPVAGPCSLHLLAASDVGRAVRTLADSRMIESPALVPPSRTLAPELPPPRV